MRRQWEVEYITGDGLRGKLKVAADSQADAGEVAKHKLQNEPHPCFIQKITEVHK
ncbi:hypothetical protein BTJ45_02934 [Bacillus mycoides]|nr:hypothetical protein BTJ45_02934 [Bacillus mycoides]